MDFTLAMEGVKEAEDESGEQVLTGKKFDADFFSFSFFVNSLLVGVIILSLGVATIVRMRTREKLGIKSDCRRCL